MRNTLAAVVVSAVLLAGCGDLSSYLEPGGGEGESGGESTAEMHTLGQKLKAPEPVDPLETFRTEEEVVACLTERYLDSINYYARPVYPPAIQRDPVSITVTEGRTATFTVYVSGTAPFTYQWHRDGKDIAGATSGSYTTPPVKKADDGARFSCTVANSKGSATSNAATLTVYVPSPDADADEDGLKDTEEVELGTDPLRPDTDGDGLADGDEVNTHETDPLSRDSDGDGMPDGWEVWNSLDPLADDASADPDGDGYTNYEEYIWGGDFRSIEMDPLTVDVTYSAANTDADGMSGSSESAGAGEDYTTTNIQEEGVDESDVVKTDGTHFYIAGGAEVKVARAVPAEDMEILSEIPVTGSVDSMYLYGDMLIVLYRDSSHVDGIPGDRCYQRVGVLVLDVADPAHPGTIGELIFEGGAQSSRVTGGRLHLVQRFTPRIYASGLERWYDGTEEDLEAVKERNRECMAAVTYRDLTPAYYEIESGAVVDSGPVIQPVNFYRPYDELGRDILTVVTIDLDDLSSGFSATAAVSSSDIIYASTQALYIVDKQGSYYTYSATTEDGYDYSQRTLIHKFDLAHKRVRNVASGSVWGWPLNQFSLGEYRDVLRIATTTGHVSRTSAAATAANHVFCLGEQGRKLVVLGSLEGLAPTERIYSARFIGKRGFLVTFKKVDPLFTLDLSDPTEPMVVGELKIPGYSDYIHPFGPDHLLTIGKDTEEAAQGDFAWYQGVQLCVFDVTDFADPRQLHKEVIGTRGTHSEALYNHKAFTYWPARNLLAIPIVLYEGGTGANRSGTYSFTGLYVYRVTVEEGFKLLGRIDTTGGADAGSYRYYRSGWTRGVFIGDVVYAVTQGAVKAAAIADVCGRVWSLALAEQ